jgi:peptidoglycan/LPS O-acetylase OafA/YrhL
VRRAGDRILPFGFRISQAHLSPTNNDFTLIRLCLASAVIWTHSVWLITGQEGVDEVQQLVGTPVSSLAVNGFFFLSGFLVTASMLKRSGVVSFLLARVGRIWPGLAGSVVVTVIGGLIFTTDVKAYLTGDATWRFILFNLSLVKGWYTLSTFTCAGEPCVVNGSLWTIPWDLRCYLALMLFYIAPSAWRHHALVAICIASLAAIALWYASGLGAQASGGMLYNIAMAARLWGMFALGSLAYAYRDRLVLSRWLAILAIAAAIAEWQLLRSQLLTALALPYALLAFAFSADRVPSLSGHWPDYSYGIYVYAFPVMLVVQAIIDTRHHPVLALLTLLATLPFAVASWHWVEKPVLDRIRERRQAQPGSAQERAS